MICEVLLNRQWAISGYRHLLMSTKDTRGNIKMKEAVRVKAFQCSTLKQFYIFLSEMKDVLYQ